MPLDATVLSNLVFATYVANFPSALQAVRANPATGVPTHCIPEVFVGALCSALVPVLQAAVIKDIGSGTTDVPGSAVPVPFTFPGSGAAEAQIAATLAWSGPAAVLAASCLVGAPLLHSSAIGLLQMALNPALGSGTGIVSPASNPTLEAEIVAALGPALSASFQATGKFGEGDIPGAPVNARLAAQLPAYAAALAKGVASISATVVYVGNTLTTVPISGVVNTGSLL